MKKPVHTTLHISAAVWFCAVCSLFLISHRIGLLGLMALMSLINMILYVRRKPAYYKCFLSLTRCTALLCIGYLLSRNEYIWYAACVISCLNALSEGIYTAWNERFVWKKPFFDDKVYWLLHLLAYGFLLWGFLFLSILSFQPERTVRELNPDAVCTNRYDPVTEETFGQYTAVRNIPYDDQYPNSVFDLIRPGTDDPPVVIWLHGGSFVSGSRSSEDHSREFLLSLLDEGFAVVSADYALAPEYHYPIPLIQTERLVRYLQTHREELGIRSDRIIFAATGSGAEIALQYLTAAYNPAYASVCGIRTPDKETFPAAYLMSVCFQPQNSDETNFVMTDFFMYQQARSYYDCFALHESPAAKRADCTPYITSDFPLIYFGEGNTGTYTEQAHRFEALLQEKGITYIAEIFDEGGNNKNLIGLSFDTEYNSYANAVHGRFLQFLRDHGLLPSKNAE